MSVWKNIKVTVTAEDLLNLMAAQARYEDTKDGSNDVDILDMKDSRKRCLKIWMDAVRADTPPQPLYRNGEGEMVKFTFAPESNTEWTVHDYQGNQVDGYDCRQAALESMGDAVFFNDSDHLPSIHFLVQGRKTIVKTMGRRKARRYA